jgi:hypothetical protein
MSEIKEEMDYFAAAVQRGMPATISLPVSAQSNITVFNNNE